MNSASHTKLQAVMHQLLIAITDKRLIFPVFCLFDGIMDLCSTGGHCIVLISRRYEQVEFVFWRRLANYSDR
jgi:hypothetical protein